MNIKKKILNSKLLKSLYGQYTDFNHGRGLLGKFTSLSNEINTVLILILGWDTFKDKFDSLLLIGVCGLIGVYLLGKVYRRSNLLEVEQVADVERNPVQKVQYDAANIIIKCFGGKKKE